MRMVIGLWCIQPHNCETFCWSSKMFSMFGCRLCFCVSDDNCKVPRKPLAGTLCVFWCICLRNGPKPPESPSSLQTQAGDHTCLFAMLNRLQNHLGPEFTKQIKIGQSRHEIAMILLDSHICWQLWVSKKTIEQGRVPTKGKNTDLQYGPFNFAIWLTKSPNPLGASVHVNKWIRWWVTFTLSQIASDLRFAIRITNRNRSQIARFGALSISCNDSNQEEQTFSHLLPVACAKAKHIVSQEQLKTLPTGSFLCREPLNIHLANVHFTLIFRSRGFSWRGLKFKWSLARLHLKGFLSQQRSGARATQKLFGSPILLSWFQATQIAFLFFVFSCP